MVTANNPDAIKFEGRSIRMVGPLDAADMQLLRAEVHEGLTRYTEIEVEFLSADINLDLDTVLGRRVTLEIDTEVPERSAGQTSTQEPPPKRYFGGHCTEIRYEGTYEGLGHYSASLRSWNWFLTQTTDCRIFQDMTALEIILQIFGEYGFTDYEDKTTEDTPKRVYCTQYRETDYDFIHRLMVEEGLYYFFESDDSCEKMSVFDNSTKHSNIKTRHELAFYFKEDQMRRREDHIFDWREQQRVGPATVTLNDFNFKRPNAELIAARTIRQGSHTHNRYEIYDYPGHYDRTDDGDRHARTREEAFAAEHDRVRAAGNVRHMACGRRFTLKNHPRDTANRKYLVIEAIHQLQIETEYNKGELGETGIGERVTLDPKKNPDPYRVTFWAQPAEAPYRAPYDCPRPRIPALQTAKVVGPASEEIYTDPDGYGMVKVKFHWDREGREDETASCWIRKAEPWTGRSWGMVWIPRIGQEVVVQFEEGDPDRPLIVGMLFNERTPHPFPLPQNKTRMGLTTRSTRHGRAGTHHELVFEDAVGEEFVRLQSERDMTQIVKNNLAVQIGQGHSDPGDMTLTVFHDLTEAVQTGNHSFTVEAGSQTVSISNNQTIEVGKTQRTTASQGDISITSEMGKIWIDAMQEIMLACGASTIEISPTKIRIQSPEIDIKGIVQARIESVMTDIKGDAILGMKGGVVVIN